MSSNNRYNEFLKKALLKKEKKEYNEAIALFKMAYKCGLNEKISIDQLKYLKNQIIETNELINEIEEEYQILNKISFADVIGQETAKKYIFDVMKSNNKKVLFYGVPGSGKTMFAMALSNELKLPFVYIKNKFRIESISSIIEKANKFSQVIIFIDEAEEYLTNEKYCTEFISYLKNSNHLIILESNKPNLINKEVLKEVNHFIRFELPTQQERYVYIKKILSSNERICEYITSITTNFSCWDIKNLCEEISMNVIKRYFDDLTKYGKDNINIKDYDIIRDDVDEIMKTFKPSFNEKNEKIMATFKPL